MNKNIVFALKTQSNIQKSPPQARKILDFLTSETSFFNSFLSNLMSNPEKFSRLRRNFLTKKNTTKNERLRKPPPPNKSGLLEGGAFLVVDFLLSQKQHFWTFQKNVTFSIFFVRFFSRDDFCFIATKQYLNKSKNTQN